MGGITLETVGKQASSAMNILGDQRGQTHTYRTLVKQANQQLQQLREQAPQEEMYLLRSAAQRAREQAQQYRQQQSAQRAALASAGINTQSASVGQWMQHQQMRALLDQQALANEFDNALAQNRQQMADKIRQLQENVQEKHRDLRQSKNKWKLGASLVSLFTQR